MLCACWYEAGYIGEALPDHLPSTIEDAILVAVELGVPYLWVDRYCIDSRYRHDVIRQMDKIYAGAELTIIATFGSNPRA